MKKRIVKIPIKNEISQKTINCEWMLFLVIDNKDTELLGYFNSWEYADIAEKAYEKHFRIKNPLREDK